jgi:hypothetical protein
VDAAGVGPPTGADGEGNDRACYDLGVRVGRRIGLGLGHGTFLWAGAVGNGPRRLEGTVDVLRTKPGSVTRCQDFCAPFTRCGCI